MITETQLFNSIWDYITVVSEGKRRAKVLVLEYILTGAITCPIGENFALASLKDKLYALSL